MRLEKNNKILLVVLALCLLLLFFYWRFNNQKSRFNWDKTYRDGLKEPYDFGVFKSLLEKNSAGHFTTVQKELSSELKKIKENDSAAYVFVGRYCYLSNTELQDLLKFASDGHHVVMIAEGVPDTLLNALNNDAVPIHFGRMDEASVTVESTNINSKLEYYDFKYRSEKQKFDIPIDWYYLKRQNVPSYYFEGLGQSFIAFNTINGHTNYAKFKKGKGFVYIHTTPMLYTNYALKGDTGFIYLTETWSGINTKNILYDVGSRDFKFDSERIGRHSDSPLSYILKQRAFKWAWYLFLLTVVLFFVFRARRRQRIVPVLELRKNTSIKFIETLGSLFYNNANHKQMAVIKMQMFNYFILHKLNIPTHQVGAETIRLIAQKSKVPEREIEKIFDYYKQVVDNGRDTLPPENLMELHNRISRFYTLYNIEK